MMSEKLGWLVVEETTRDGCDISPSIHHFYQRAAAEKEAQDLRDIRSDDDHYSATVRRESQQDADQYGNYVNAG